MSRRKTITIATLVLSLCVEISISNGQRIYWADPLFKKIQSADLDGSNARDVITARLVAPYDMAVDVAAGKMYWTDPRGDRIQRADLDGSNFEDVVVDGLDSPKGIALDVADGKIYWLGSGGGGSFWSPMIRRANMDGSNVENLIRGGYYSGAGFAVDPGSRKMYWTVRGATSTSGAINRASLDGTGLEVVIPGLNSPAGLVLDLSREKIYWMDRGTIWHSNLSGDDIEALFETPSGLRDMTIDAGAGKVYWTQEWIGINLVQRADLDGENVESLVTTNSPGHIILDVAGGKVYWTSMDEEAGNGVQSVDKIQQANLDGSNVEDFVTADHTRKERFALDLRGGGMIYWTDSAANTIQRAKLDGSQIEDLITTGLDKPRGIALDTSAGKMYWTGSGVSTIQRANLDGSDVEGLVGGRAAPSPVGIALHPDAGKMYWVDSFTEEVGRANLDGSDVESVASAQSYLTNVVLDPIIGTVCWMRTPSIWCANLEGDVKPDRVVWWNTYWGGMTFEIGSGHLYYASIDDVGPVPVACLDLDGGQGSCGHFGDPIYATELALDFREIDDCDGNGIDDAYDLADCDGVPACDDCDGNGRLDRCDIAGGEPDANGNGVLDQCEPCTDNASCDDSEPCSFDRCIDNLCSYDLDSKYGDVAGEGGVCGPDGDVNLSDILSVLDGFVGDFAEGCERSNIDIAGEAGSCEPNEIIDLSDILGVLDAFQGLDRCCAARR